MSKEQQQQEQQPAWRWHATLPMLGFAAEACALAAEPGEQLDVAPCCCSDAAVRQSVYNTQKIGTCTATLVGAPIRLVSECAAAASGITAGVPCAAWGRGTICGEGARYWG